MRNLSVSNISYKQEKKQKKMLKGLTRNIKIGLNTIEQAVTMIQKSGIDVRSDVMENEDEVIVTLRFPK